MNDNPQEIEFSLQNFPNLENNDTSLDNDTDQEVYLIEREQNRAPQHVQYPIVNYQRDIDLQEDIDNGWKRVDNNQVPDYCHFIGNEGLNMNTTSRNPEDFFNNLFDDRMYTIIAEETNNYAWQQKMKVMANRDPFEHMNHYSYQRHAYLGTWKDLNSSDIRISSPCYVFSTKTCSAQLLVNIFS